MGPRTLSANRLRRLSSSRFALQIASVVFVYLAANFFIGAAFLATQTGLDPSATPEFSNLAVLSTTALSMLAALATARAWLVADGCVKQAWNIRPPSNPRRTLVLAALGTGVIIALFGIGNAAIEALGLPSPDISIIIGYVTESPLSFALWIVVIAWFTAGFGEEMLYRGFLLDRLMRLRWLRGSRWLPAVIQAVIFGLAHFYQGWGGVLLTGVIGLFLAWMRFADRGGLWACILAHALVDTIMLSLIYAESVDWLG